MPGRSTLTELSVDGHQNVIAMAGQRLVIELSTTSNTRWCRPVPSSVLKCTCRALRGCVSQRIWIEPLHHELPVPPAWLVSIAGWKLGFLRRNPSETWT
jgi:hypothetical protein